MVAKSYEMDCEKVHFFRKPLEGQGRIHYADAYPEEIALQLKITRKRPNNPTTDVP